MAEIQVSQDKRNFHLEISWDFKNIIDSVSRLRGANGDKFSGIKIIGRALDEISGGLIEALSPYDPAILDDDRSLKLYIAKNIRQSPNLDQKLSLLFRRISDWALDRFNVDGKNGSLWEYDHSELAKNIFRNENNYFSDPRIIREIVDDVATAFDGKVVLLQRKSHATPYFKVLLPCIMKASKNSTFIILSERNQFEEIKLPILERDYLNHNNIVDVCAELLNTNPLTANQFINKHKLASYAYEGRENYLTKKEFNYSVNYYVDLAKKYGIDEIPAVPAPNPAPLQFIVSERALAVSDITVSTSTTSEVVNAALQEIVDLLNDVQEHHNLSNAAPVLSAKVGRLREKAEKMGRNAITPPDVVSFGMLTDAIDEGLQAQKDEIMPAAEGALKSVVTQSRIFVNRFNDWRIYIRDGHLRDEDVTLDSAIMAREILKIALETPFAIEKKSILQIESVVNEVSEGTLPAERRGVVASIQNMIAIASAYAKELVITSSRNALNLGASVGFKVIVTIGTGAIILLILRAEPMLLSLAQAHPHIFGWVGDFLAWLKASIEIVN